LEMWFFTSATSTLIALQAPMWRMGMGWIHTSCWWHLWWVKVPATVLQCWL
jgi:hypothetical protein